MGYLEKENTLIKRNGEGKLLPIEVTLELLPDKPKIKMIPLTKGRLNELVTCPEGEDKLIREHVVDPEYTEEEFGFIKPQVYGAIKMALLSLSTDTSQEDMQKSSISAVLDDVKKKSLSQNEN